MNTEQRYAMFNEYLSQGRITRGAWRRKDDDGRELACLLAAFGQDINDSRDCPASIMPQWLAYLTPDINDNGTEGEWPAMVQRYGAAANRWRLLDDAAWRRVLLRTLDATLAVAEPHDARGVVAPVRELIAHELRGDMPLDAEWQAAAEVAWAARAAAWAARAAAWAARAARAAARAAAAAEAAAAAAEAAAATAKVAAAWDRITDALLTAIEDEIEKVEVAIRKGDA